MFTFYKTYRVGHSTTFYGIPIDINRLALALYIYVLRLTDKGSYYQGVLDRESNVQTVATCWNFSCKTPG